MVPAGLPQSGPERRAVVTRRGVPWDGRDLSRGCDSGAGVWKPEVRLGLGETDSLAGFQFSDGGGENA